LVTHKTKKNKKNKKITKTNKKGESQIRYAPRGLREQHEDVVGIYRS